jgi:mannose-6-phosphate isomerase-like protein (cupin superfamily)
MTTPVINFADKFAQFSDLWSPKIVAQMNDYHFKLAKIKGEFIWHDHPNTDEVFIVIQDSLTIHLRDNKVELNEGEMYVVPKGVEHKPFAVKNVTSCSLSQLVQSTPAKKVGR